eukprot:TRINITY_DN8405_c0_g2_i4.p1 TRINITY_DN8405_c0_g2~~TRINITY_DN8405_c0_g2_i4.p1  ORF type:complete len:683 (+),score=166.52 TRINITY_DN8405_c0_g2_i4:321-2369(+)
MAIGCLLFGLLLPQVLNHDLEDRPQVCDEESTGYGKWLTNDPSNQLGVSGPFVPRYRKFYVWNMTNPAEFLQGGKPIMQELGPYTYHSYSTKFNVSFTSTTQTYRTWFDLKFSPENSCATCVEDDNVTMMNPVYLELLAKSQGETNFMLGAGVPIMVNLVGGNATFLSYASSHCGLPSSVTTATKLDLSQAFQKCVLTRPKATELLKHEVDGTMKPALATQLALCGFDTAAMPAAEQTSLLSCSLSYWGVPSYNPQSGNLIDLASPLIKEVLLGKDGLVVTKTVGAWYIGGPSTLAALLEKGASWPGFGIRHADTLSDANKNPEIKYDTVVSGCGGSLDRIGDYVMAQDQTSIDYSFWGKSVTVPVTGSNNVQTTPKGISALNSDDNGPYSTTLFEWADQLKRPAALTFIEGVDYKGVHVNRFEMPRSELVGSNPVMQPGVDALGSDLGVGVLPGATKNIAGIVDMSPFEGFPLFVSMPHYYQGDPALQDYATLLTGDIAANYVSYMEVEPASGTTFGGALRLQAATMVNRTAAGGSMTTVFYPNVTPQVLVPLYWLDETAFISDTDLDLFKTVLELDEAARWTLYIGPAFCGVLAVFFTGWALHDRGCLESHEPLEESPESPSEGRRSSLLSSRHSKAGEYPDRGSWSERCSLAQDCAKSCTQKLGGCARASAGSAHETLA